MTEVDIGAIVSWFSERDYELDLLKDDGGWKAPYMPRGRRIGSSGFGVGDTPHEAALDAQAKFEADKRTGLVGRARY